MTHLGWVVVAAVILVNFVVNVLIGIAVVGLMQEDREIDEALTPETRMESTVEPLGLLLDRKE